MGENKKQSIWEAYKFSIILLGAIFIGGTEQLPSSLII